MQLTTKFYYVLSSPQTSELSGLVSYSKYRNQIKQHFMQEMENDFKVSCLQVDLNTDTEAASLIDVIESTFHTRPTYHYKHNSVNFNLTELPFQTYEAFLSPLDTLAFFAKHEDKSNIDLEEKLKDFIAYHPSKEVKDQIIKFLNVIASDEEFVDGDWSTVITTMDLERADISRFWNHMLFLEAWMSHIPSAKDFTLAYIESLTNKTKLDELRRG